MDLSDPTSPLINDYKLAYLLQVVPQTFLGGLRLRFPFKLPWYVYGIQVLAWSFPFFVGALCTLICELTAPKHENIIASVYGLAVFVCLLTFNVIVVKIRKQTDVKKVQTSNFLMEEDEIEITSCFSFETIEFLIPRKRYWFNHILHPLLYGLTCTFSIVFLLPRNTEPYLGNKTGSIVYCLFSWFVVCISVYSLIGKSPKEPNTFAIHEHFDVSLITRSVYVLLIVISSFISRMFGVYTTFHLVVYTLFVLLPVLWLFGVLPNIDVLMSWSTEYFVVHCMGGSHMATDLRLAMTFLLSLFSTLLAYFLGNRLASMTLCAVCGIVLSVDIGSLIIKYVNILRLRTQVLSQSSKFVQRNFRNGILLLVFTLLTASLVVLVEVYDESFNKQVLVEIFSCVSIALIILCDCVCSLQQVLICGLFKNPLFFVVNESSFLRTLLSKLSIGLITYVSPFVLVFYGTVLINKNGWDDKSFIDVVLLFRFYRKIWQNTMNSLHDFAVITILQWSGHNILSSLSFPVEMFTVSLLLFWCKSLLKKCWFIALLVYSSKTLKGDHSKVNNSIILSCCFIPLLLVILLVSVALSSPLLPLFTLPLFIIGFPRPLRSWPNADTPTKSSSNDWVYYEQLIPALLEQLSLRMNPCGLLKPNAGSYYLARFQDRLIWVSVLETGLFYYLISVKGLELQETSCHAREAESIDEVFNASGKIMHIMNMKTIFTMNVYSDAKSVLTGIIENHAFLDEVRKQYPRMLTWVLMEYSMRKRSVNVNEDHEIDTPNSLFQNSTTKVTGGTATTSLTGDGWIDDASLHATRKRKHSLRKEKIAPTYCSNDNVDSKEDEFSDFGFSDNDDSPPSSDDDLSCGDNNRNTIIHLPGGDSKVLDPPTKWLSSLPLSEVELMSESNVFPKNWYETLIYALCNEERLNNVIKDEKLRQHYKLLVLCCFQLTEKESTKEPSKPSHVLDMFHNRLPWSLHSTWFEENNDLKVLVVKAYRLAFKLVYDSFLLGGALDDDEETISFLDDHQENWFIGENDTQEWMMNVTEEKPNLFAIDQNQNGLYTSRMLTLQNIPVPIAALQEECVRGMWSALSLELFYMTNDDDERYSIQAMPQLLRNIVTQAADPPLGYPVYSSGLIQIAIP